MIYYAHSMRIYDTIKEREELEFLKSKFEKICNPNGDIQPCRSMVPYLKAVERSDMVVFSRYFGHMGRGVYEEIKHAQKHKIPVKMIVRGLFQFELREVKKVKIHNKNDWAIEYGMVVE